MSTLTTPPKGRRWLKAGELLREGDWCHQYKRLPDRTPKRFLTRDAGCRVAPYLFRDSRQRYSRKLKGGVK